jgi:hypothetical protein
MGRAAICVAKFARRLEGNHQRDVLFVDVLEPEAHSEIVGCDGHGVVFLVQSRRMTRADPVPGMDQPKLAVTSTSFTLPAAAFLVVVSMAALTVRADGNG